MIKCGAQIGGFVYHSGCGVSCFLREVFFCSSGEINFPSIFLKYLSIWLLIFLNNLCHC